jgi:shikimate dehydrogenase
MNIYGLIGKNIQYSFSKIFFEKKFKEESIKNCIYKIFDIDDISFMKNYIIHNNNIKGLNVTIPYKEKIIEIIDDISENILHIGSVNTLKIINYKIIGYNTDVIGFEKSFFSNNAWKNKKALILGSGGASKAVSYILKNHNIEFIIISRNGSNKYYTYTQINDEIMNEYKIIINTTPLGTYPDIYNYPNIPYKYITSNHYLYDLIYNPNETIFLKKGKEKNAVTKNGLEMLYIQANESWKIWNT